LLIELNSPFLSPVGYICNRAFCALTAASLNYVAEEAVKGKVDEFEVQLDCLKVRHSFCDHTSSVSGVTELEGLLGYTFQLPLQLHEVCCNS
jgi:hypothetical protein